MAVEHFLAAVGSCVFVLRNHLVTVLVVAEARWFQEESSRSAMHGELSIEVEGTEYGTKLR